MKREFLESLGLEAQTINSIMAVHGQSVSHLNEQINNLSKEKDQLTEQLEQRDNQLEELKGNGADDLKNQIANLQSENDKLKETHANELLEQKRTHKLEMLASTIGVNEEAKEFVMFKLKDLEFKDGELIGADEAVANLKESAPSIFVQPEAEAKPKPKWSAGGVASVGNGTKTKAEIMAIKNTAERQKAIAENIELFK